MGRDGGGYYYQPATANRMLSALRVVLKECWHAQLVPYGSGLRRAGAVALEFGDLDLVSG
jgi:hypothetical protein